MSAKTASHDIIARVDLEDRLDRTNGSQHEEIVGRIQAMYQATKRDQVRADAPYQPGGEWVSYTEERRGFYDALLSGPVSQVADMLRRFWRNELSPIVKEYAQFSQLASAEQRAIDRFETLLHRNYLIWKGLLNCEDEVLRVPAVGNPWGVRRGDLLIVPKAMRYHLLADQIIHLIEDIEQPVVAEIGAGYGGAAYYFMRDAPTATYIDFDLPETLVLAAYYLLACHPDKKFILYGEAEAPLSSMAVGPVTMFMPNYCLPELPEQSVDVLLNSFSFSELLPETLETYMEVIGKAVSGYLLHNNMDRQGVVNRGFERIPSSSYPIPRDLKLVYKRFDVFHGADGDYKEYLYERKRA